MFGDSERKSDVTINSTENVTSPLPSLDANTKKCRPNSFQVRDKEHTTRDASAVSEDLLSQKNSLLEIIQTFSEKRNVATASQKTAENDNDGSHNCKVDITNASARRNTVDDVRNDSFASASCPTAPSPQNSSLEIIEEDGVTTKPSILKKKFEERSNSVDSPKPNSILKRKTFEETGSLGINVRTKTHRQGILKKHSSLDEEEVARRSCSPDISELGKSLEFKPILKSQRRSSLEEIVRIRSPPELHSILKRSKQPNEEVSDSSVSSPHHGILKRKISVTNGFYDLRSVDSDVISDTESTVKPILKNKIQSLEVAMPEKALAETPRPILKKKFSDTECDEEKPTKPILKSSRKSLDENRISSNRARFVDWQSGGEECNIKPILKKRDEYHRMDTRSVKSDDDSANSSYRNTERIKRNSLPGEFDFMNHRKH